MALTHRSLAADAPNNEKLEFLGDAVLALAMSDVLMARFPTPARASCRSLRVARERRELARQARALELGPAGSGSGRARRRAADATRRRSSPPATRRCSARSTSTRATNGAPPGRRAALRERRRAHRTAGLRDYKTQLQEITQRLFRETPVYTLVEESGPDHDKRFISELSIDGRACGRGEGRSKKPAEQAAAMQALDALSRERPDAVS